VESFHWWEEDSSGVGKIEIVERLAIGACKNWVADATYGMEDALASGVQAMIFDPGVEADTDDENENLLDVIEEEDLMLLHEDDVKQVPRLVRGVQTVKSSERKERDRSRTGDECLGKLIDQWYITNGELGWKEKDKSLTAIMNWLQTQ